MRYSGSWSDSEECVEASPTSTTCSVFAFDDNFALLTCPVEEDALDATDLSFLLTGEEAGDEFGVAVGQRVSIYAIH